MTSSQFPSKSSKTARSRRPLPKWLLTINVLYALTIALISLCNAIGPERWWFIAFNMYMPQAIWLAPGVFLLLVTLGFQWRSAWIPVLVMAWVAGPLMGVVPHAPQPDVTRASDVFLRVMTYNVKWGREDPQAVVADIQKYNPDLIVMQDSAGVQQTAVGTAFATYDVQVDGQYTIASRLPVSSLTGVDISFPGSDHHCDRFRLLVGGTEVTIYTAHLLSPRVGLSNVRHHHIKPMKENVADRLIEGQLLTTNYEEDQAANPAPAVLMGDLNSPPPSMVVRELTSAGLHDAFSAAGSGYGYSYGGLTVIGAPYIRIDHIMVNKYFRVSKCWVGNSIGSDHSPLIADLVKVATRSN